MLLLIRKALPTICLLFGLLYGLFLFDNTDHLLKRYLVAVLLLNFIFNFPDKKTLYTFKQFISPWTPWIIGCLLIPLFVHGSKGLHYQLHLLLIISLLLCTLKNYKLDRRLVIVSVGITSLIISFAVCIDILINGLTVNVLGQNKNIVLGGICLMCSILVMYGLTSHYSHDRPLKVLAICSIVVSLLATILAEVRTSIVGFFGLFIICTFFLHTQIKRLYLSIFFFIIAMTVASFVLTGRLQEGFNDLVQWQHGNPDSSWGIRIELWRLALSAVKDHFLLGWGYQPFNAIIQQGYVFPVTDFPAQHLHNDYISYLATYGVLGLIGWLGTLFLMFKQAIHDPYRLALLGSMSFMGLTDCFWSFSHFVLYIFATLWTFLWLSQPSEN